MVKIVMTLKISLLTAHASESLRKVDFHFWRDECLKKEMDVRFVSLGFSLFTMLKKRNEIYSSPYNCWRSGQNPHLQYYHWRPIFHPFSINNKLIDWMTGFIFNKYPCLVLDNLLKGLEGTDLFIIENGVGLMLVPLLRNKFPKAKFIYSVCDRIQTLTYHPVVLKAEAKSLPLFDAIRVPAEVMKKDYHGKHNNVHYIPHGLEKNLFNKKSKNPYLKEKNIISVGDMLFDQHSIKILATEYPEYNIHLFGRESKLDNKLENVIEYGEVGFDTIIPFLQHADIGLAPYKIADRADYLCQSSMKMIQYTYCQLPILAPHFATSGRENVVGYSPGNKESICKAMDTILLCRKEDIDISKIVSWSSMLDSMFDSVQGI